MNLLVFAVKGCTLVFGRVQKSHSSLVSAFYYFSIVMKKLLLSSILLAVAFSASKAAVILSDSFNAANSPSLNNNLDTRQSGSLAPISYLVEAEGVATNSASISGNSLVFDPLGNFVDGNVLLDLNLNTAASHLLIPGFNQFTISFNATLSGGNYTGFFVGAAQSAINARPVIDTSVDFGILLKNNLSVEIWEGGGSPKVNSSNALPTLSGLDNYVFTFTTDNFDSGTPYTVSLAVGGTTVDLNGAAGGLDYSGTWDGGASYIVFTNRGGALGSTTVIDNLTLTAIPEPGTYALMAGTIAILFALRRRA